MNLVDLSRKIKSGEAPITNELILQLCDSVIDAEYIMLEYAEKEYDSGLYTDFQLQQSADFWLERWDK